MMQLGRGSVLLFSYFLLFISFHNRNDIIKGKVFADPEVEYFEVVCFQYEAKPLGSEFLYSCYLEQCVYSSKKWVIDFFEPGKERSLLDDDAL